MAPDDRPLPEPMEGVTPPAEAQDDAAAPGAPVMVLSGRIVLRDRAGHDPQAPTTVTAVEKLIASALDASGYVASVELTRTDNNR